MFALKSLSMCGRCEVSTVAMREPMPDGRSFKTMVFDLHVDDEVDSRRYEIWDQAAAGHDELLQEIGLIESALSDDTGNQRTRVDAVAIAPRAERGTLCPHDYRPGQVICPGCDDHKT